jgi:hypothetical protein
MIDVSPPPASAGFFFPKDRSILDRTAHRVIRFLFRGKQPGVRASFLQLRRQILVSTRNPSHATIIVNFLSVIGLAVEL